MWSRNTTWGGGPAPLAGDSVWIPPGQTLILDTSPPKLYMLVIQGHLVFDRVDLSLDLNYIFVMGGSLTIGTEREPFLQSAQDIGVDEVRLCNQQAVGHRGLFD